MNWLSTLAITSPLSYLIAVLLPAFDAIIPVLPSETAIITLGVATAGSTDPRIAVLVLLAALGAFLGDNLDLPDRPLAGPGHRAPGVRGREGQPTARPGPPRPWNATAGGSSSPAGSCPAAARRSP